MSAEIAEPYVIRTVRLDAIRTPLDSCGLPVERPGRDERRAALHFDGPIAAAEVLLGPLDAEGRYRVLAGAERVSHARDSGRIVLLAAVVGRSVPSRCVLGRWHVHHAA